VAGVVVFARATRVVPKPERDYGVWIDTVIVSRELEAEACDRPCVAFNFLR
jgi:hypothetical protein